MTVYLDMSLEQEEMEALEATDPRWWFTQVRFANAQSPRHPGHDILEPKNQMKRVMMLPWLRRLAPSRSVLDTFCANGAFSFEAATLGASMVLGTDFDADRIHCAQMVASWAKKHAWTTVPDFVAGDVYRLGESVQGIFDITLCLGGLYHVADPVLVLTNLRGVTAKGGYLLMQTSEILDQAGSWATFYVHGEDRTQEGFSSLRAGSGRWRFTYELVDRMLEHAGFEVMERRRPPRRERRRFPWYCTLARAV